MSRYSRNVRSLFAILIREYPNLQVLWSVSPSHSAELFEELKVYFILFFSINLFKLDQSEPILEIALKKKRDCNVEGIVDRDD